MHIVLLLRHLRALATYNRHILIMSPHRSARHEHAQLDDLQVERDALATIRSLIDHRELIGTASSKSGCISSKTTNCDQRLPDRVIDMIFTVDFPFGGGCRDDPALEPFLLHGALTLTS